MVVRTPSYMCHLSNLKINLQKQLISCNFISSELMIDQDNKKEILSNINAKLDRIKEIYIINDDIYKILITYPYLIDLIYESIENNSVNDNIVQKTLINSINNTTCDICFEKYKPTNFGAVFTYCGHSCCHNCFRQMKTSKCHICRADIKSVVNKNDLKKYIEIKKTDNITKTVLDLIFQNSTEIFSNKYIDSYSNTYFLYKILFNLPLILEFKNSNNFNKILLNYFNNISSIEPIKIAFFAAVYYSIHNKNNNNNNFFQEKYSEICQNQKININIFIKLIYSPDIFLNFIHILKSFNNSNICIFDTNLDFSNNNLNQINDLNYLLDNNLKNIIEKIITNFELNQRTCIEFNNKKNNQEFQLLFKYLYQNDIKNEKNEKIRIFNNYIFKKKDNIYFKFLQEIKKRGLKEFIDKNNNKIFKLHNNSKKSKIFICKFKNIKFNLCSYNLEKSYLEIKFFLLLNKNRLNLTDHEIINSKSHEYNIIEIDENSLEII